MKSMKKTLLILISFSLVGFGFAQTTKPAGIPKSVVNVLKKPATTNKAITTKPATAVSVVLKSAKDSASYALGFRVAQSMKGQGLQDINMALFNKGFSAGVIAKSIIPDSLLDVCIKKYQDNMSLEKITFNKAVGKAFLEGNAKKPGVVSMSNGMQYEVMVAGTGSVKPTLSNKVKCHYHGTLIDGSIFDSSVQRGEPISFPLNGVIKGWQDGVQLMTVGSKWKLFIPSDLAYGDRSAGPFIGPGMTLIFEVELLGIE
jgi:FKBP-type peptidyl-prolyl cis-trans isomerase FklB